MLKLGIISNPFAKMNKNDPELNTQMWYTLANEGQYEITHSIFELEKVCLEFCKRGINIVGIVGGDGSIGLVLSNIYKAYCNEQNLPKILLLKGGTINFLASNLGIKASATKCLNDTLFYLKKNSQLFEVSVRSLNVNGRLGFIFAGGLAARFLEEYYKNKKDKTSAALKILKYAIDGAFPRIGKGVFKKISKAESLEITTHPLPLWSQKLSSKTTEYTLVFASTVPKLPFNVKLFKKLNLINQNAEIMAITESGKNLIKGMMHAFMGRDIASYQGVDSVLFEKCSIQGETSLSYSLDGDLLVAEDGHIHIEYGPSFIFCSPYYISSKGS